MTNSPISDAERKMLAAEYALGLLEPAEHAQAAWLYRTDPAFAQEADRWTEEGAEWIDESEADAPSEETYQRIAASLGLDEAQPHEAHEAHEPLARQEPVASSTPGAWRPFALAASLAAVTFAGLWLFDRPSAPEQATAVPEPTTASYSSDNLSIAQINSADATSLVSALYDGDTGTLYIRLTDIPDPERVRDQRDPQGARDRHQREQDARLAIEAGPVSRERGHAEDAREKRHPDRHGPEPVARVDPARTHHHQRVHQCRAKRKDGRRLHRLSTGLHRYQCADEARPNCGKARAAYPLP